MRTLIFSWILLVTAQAHAGIVADNFNCELNFVSTDGSMNATASGNLTALRGVEIPIPPPPNATYTDANATSNLTTQLPGGHTVQVTLGLSYNHVLVTDTAGKQKAGENGCLLISYIVDGQSYDAACATGPFDPNDPLVGWNPVSITNGVPSFDPSILTPATQAVPGYGTASASCTYINTIQ